MFVIEMCRRHSAADPSLAAQIAGWVSESLPPDNVVEIGFDGVSWWVGSLTGRIVNDEAEIEVVAIKRPSNDLAARIMEKAFIWRSIARQEQIRGLVRDL